MSPEDNRRTIYVGSAAHWIENHPDDGDDRGGELLLRNAMMDAYENAMQGSDGRERAFRVVGIFIEGTNPPSDYKVHLADHP
jgi:hypothetical protein